jgi:hypothetical protein
MVSGKQNGRRKQKRCNGIRRGQKVMNGYAKKKLGVEKSVWVKKK